MWSPSAARLIAGLYREGTGMPDSGNTQTRRELIERLAPLIWQERQQEAEYYASIHSRQRPPWYFLNVNHPTIKRLYLQYLQKSLNGTPLAAPIGDLDRVKFELSLLHPAVLRMLAEEYQEADSSPAEQSNQK